MENKNMFNAKTTGKVFSVVSVILLSAFFYFFKTNAIMFHISMEFTIVIMGVIAAMIGILTAQKSKNNILTRTSPALLFYSLVVYIHNLAYPGINIFPDLSLDIAVGLKLFANLILALGFLVAVIDRRRRIKPLPRFIICFLVSLTFSILTVTNVWPEFIALNEYTTFKVAMEILVIVLLVSALLLLVLNKKERKDPVNRLIILPMVLLILSELFFLHFYTPSDIQLYISLTIKYVAIILFLYQIIRINLLTPYNNLVYSLMEDKRQIQALAHDSAASYERLNQSQSIGHVGTWELDIPSKKIWASDEAFRIYGLHVTPDNLINLNTIQTLVIPDDRKMMDRALYNLLTRGIDYNVNFSIINAKGEFHYLNSVATLEYDESGKPLKGHGVIHDITQLKREQDKLLHESTHDHLTGVYNRRYFSEQRIHYNTQDYLPMSFAIIDINGLKVINDSFGHHAGNIVLRRLAQVLEKHMDRKEDFVARIGGDEFSIFFTNRTQEEAEIQMQTILEHIAKERVGNIEISVAYGIATRLSLDEDIDATLKRAEDEMYLYKISDSQSVRNKIIDALLKTLYEKDTISEAHSQRVSDYAFFLAKACHLSTKKINDIKTAGLLHDIGKITISNEILNKKGKLLKNEYDIIKTHPERGYKIIHSIGDMDIIANYVQQHHERMDGKGYPKGLSGDDITLEARIIAIADAFDAMTSHREYKDKMSLEEAVEELRRCKDTQFDGELVERFITDVLEKQKSMVD